MQHGIKGLLPQYYDLLFKRCVLEDDLDPSKKLHQKDK